MIMEEKETKIVIMPLHEYEQMRAEIQRLKSIGIHSELVRYVGVDIAYLEELYKAHGEIPLYKYFCKEFDRLVEEKGKLLKEEIELKQDLKLLRKQFDIYYNRCVELKEEINNLQEKKWWQFWK